MNAQVETPAAEATAETTKKAAPATEKVKMNDGREVEFVGVKRKMLKEAFIGSAEDPQGIYTRFDFRNGDTRTFRLPDSLIPQFAAHGALQKIGDETAGETDVEDMVLAVDAVIERLSKGEWAAQRESGGMSGTSTLLKALVEFSNGSRTVDQVKDFLKGKSQAEKIALRNSPKLKPIIDRIEQEKAAKAANVDTEGLLAAL